MKHLRTILISSVVTICFAVAATTLQKNSSYPQYSDEVIERVVGGHTVYVPKEYLKFRTSNVGANSMRLHAWYPGAAPPPSGDSYDLRVNKKIIWRSVRILAKAGVHPTKAFDTFARQATESLHATVYVGEKHGLHHFTQKAEENPDAKDVWFEKSDKEIHSYIRCGDKILVTDVPQCQQTFWIDRDYLLNVSFNKNLLPHWKVIKTNILAMFDSFSSREAATQFIQNQISQVTSTKEND